MDTKKIARTFGIVFLLTWVTAITARVLFDPAYNDAGYIVGAGSDARVQLGAVFEFLLIVANIGTAVVLYPIAKQYSENGSNRIRDGTRHGVGLHHGRHPVRAVNGGSARGPRGSDEWRYCRA
jgi:hypothetical protein